MLSKLLHCGAAIHCAQSFKHVLKHATHSEADAPEQCKRESPCGAACRGCCHTPHLSDLKSIQLIASLVCAPKTMCAASCHIPCGSHEAAGCSPLTRWGCVEQCAAGRNSSRRASQVMRTADSLIPRHTHASRHGTRECTCCCSICSALHMHATIGIAHHQAQRAGLLSQLPCAAANAPCKQLLHAKPSSSVLTTPP